jgi:type IV pilus secretin PilQ/predicted competence protein
MHRYSLLLGLGFALLIGTVVPTGIVRAGAEGAMLKKIASRLDERTGVIAIEATDPVPYIASQPDPKTFVVELREVVARGFADDFTADPRQPFSGVQVESTHAVDGVNVTRVRMTLSQPQRPRVRSARNVIYVEAERADAPMTAAGRISLAGPAPTIRDVRVSKRGGATAVSLLGTARLIATSVQETKEGGRKIVIDLPNVTSAVQNVTDIKQGPVERLRVGLNPRVPLMTQVTLDLSRAATYRVESSPDGNDLTLVFDEQDADPIAALTPATAATPKTPAAPAVAVSRDENLLPLAPPVAPVVSAVVTPARVLPPSLQQPAPTGPAPQQPVPTPLQPIPQAPAAPQGVAPGQTPAASRFTGHPVTLDFQGADLRAVLRTFSEISGLNIVLDPTIQGTVDVALRDVPWDQALDIILRANKLGHVVDGTIVRIAPLTVLADEEAQRQKLTEAQALAGELQVVTRALSYAKAEDLRALLTATALSSRGSIQTDARTNTIIINDLAERLERASALLDTLDRPEPQVEIEARIVQTTRDFARSIGVQWGATGRAVPALGNTLPLAFPNSGTVSGRAGGAGNLVDLGVSGATTAAGLALGSINGALNLDVALSALESTGQGRILSTPRVSTQNNIEAEIMQGLQIPIQTVANNTVTVTFRDAALTLRVTPQITAANTVIMRIMVENSSPDFSRAVNDIPPIDTQRATTQVLVSTGETTVIGGIYISREQTSEDRTPGLHRLPLLGWLFKRNQFSDESRELLIFITPKIMRL